MSRYMNVRLLVALGSLLVLSGARTLAQADVFSSQGAPSTAADCEAVKNGAIAQLRSDVVKANEDLKQANLNCNAAGDDPGCVATLRERKRLIGIGFRKRDIEAETARQICAERLRLPAAASAGPCERRNA